MKSIFSYDSPVMQILMYIGDLIILNFFYLLCCIPIFTIGAAQAGLYTAMRVLNDKEDDSSPTAAFFRGFKNGFGKVTLAWGLLSVFLLVLAFCASLAYIVKLAGWICVASVCICALFQTLVPAFHSRFDCTAMQLIRNCWFLLVGHPLRSIGVTVLIWLPVIVFALDSFLFLSAGPIWCTVYFSTAGLFAELFLRKPFETLVNEFNRRKAEEAEADGETPAIAESAEESLLDAPEVQ